VNTGNLRTPPTRPEGRLGRRPLRATPQPSRLERNRSRLLWGLAAVAVLAMAGIAFLNATSPAYGCSTEWTPAVTAAPAPEATARLGYVQTDLGREHTSLGAFVRYALCPPATGKHYNAQGEGPVRPGVYGPDDQATPQGWIHNLEHGSMILLYRCTGSDTACTDDGQAALKQFNATFPNSPVCNLPVGVVGPIIARFDQMRTPYAALVWGIVLPLDTLDTDRILAFFAQQGERTNPEPYPGCVKPTPTPGPTAAPTPVPSATAAPSPSPTPGAS